MGAKTNLGLLVLVGGLGAYLYYGKDDRGTEPVAATIRALRSHNFLDAHQIMIWPKQKDRAAAIKVVKKKDGTYWVREPVNDQASRARLLELHKIFNNAVLLEGHSAEQLQKKPEMLAEFGLDAPKRTIAFHFRKGGPSGTGEVIKLEIGKPTLHADEVWLKRDDTLYRCPSLAVDSALNILPDDMREKPLLDQDILASLKVARVTRKTIDGTYEELELTRGEGNEFHITRPQAMRADQQRIQTYLTIVAGLYADEFLSGAPQELMVARPDYHFQIKGDRGTEDIQIWKNPKPPHNYFGYHQRRNIAFGIKPVGLNALNVKTDLLRARVLIPFKQEQIVKMVLEPGAGQAPTVLEMGRGLAFRMSRPVQSALDPTALAELQRGVRTLQVREFLQGNPDDYGLGKDSFRLTVQENRSRKVIHLRLGKDKGELTYVMREDEPYICTVPKEYADKLRQPWYSMVSKQVLSLDTIPERLEVWRDGKRTFTYIKSDGEWKREGEAQEDDAIAEIVENLRPLRASRVLPQTDDLGTPLVLKFQRRDGDTLLTMRAWNKGGQTLVRAENYVSGVVYLLKALAWKQKLALWLR